MWEDLCALFLWVGEKVCDIKLHGWTIAILLALIPIILFIVFSITY